MNRADLSLPQLIEMNEEIAKMVQWTKGYGTVKEHWYRKDMNSGDMVLAAHSSIDIHFDTDANMQLNALEHIRKYKLHEFGFIDLFSGDPGEDSECNIIFEKNEIEGRGPDFKTAIFDALYKFSQHLKKVKADAEH